LVYVSLGVAAGAAGAGITLFAIPKGSLLFDFTFGSCFGLRPSAAGVIGGWFVASLIVSAAPGRVRCPRRGVANDRSNGRCSACDLPLVSG
jgi:hypothetical protein